MVCVDENPTIGAPFPKGIIALVPNVFLNNMSYEAGFAKLSPSFVDMKCCGSTFGVVVKATWDKKNQLIIPKLVW
jgi:hypothetical protein